MPTKIKYNRICDDCPLLKTDREEEHYCGLGFRVDELWVKRKLLTQNRIVKANPASLDSDLTTVSTECGLQVIEAVVTGKPTKFIADGMRVRKYIQ